MKFNENLYRKEKHWKEGEFDVYRNMQWTGPGCHEGCGVLFYVKDGKVDHIEGDPNDEFSRGRLCMRCLNMVDEAINNPTRLGHPLKRVGYIRPGRGCQSPPLRPRTALPQRT